MLAKLLHVLLLLGHPDASVVTQGLAHKGELALLLSVHGDAGGVNLGEAGICEIRSLLVALQSGGTVAVHGVGGQEIGVSIASGGDYHGVGSEPLELSGDKIAGDDTLRLTVDDHEIEHFMAGIGLHGSVGYLLVERGVCAEKELLSGLTAGVESTADLDSSERAVRQVSAVFTGEGNSLGDTLVDDGSAHLGKTVDVGFARAVVSTLDGVVEQTVDGVVVVLVVLRGIDTSLGCNGVSTARGIADAEDFDVVAEFTE